MKNGKKLKNFWKKIVDWKNAFLDAVCKREAEIEKAKTKRAMAGLVLGLAVVLLIVFYVTVGRRIILLVKDPQAFKDWLNGFGGWHAALFVLLRVAQTAFKVIPGEPLEIAAGCAFGAWGGLFWCLLGSFVGSVVILGLGRRYGRKMVGLFVSPKNLKLTKIFKNGRGMDATIVILYLVPGLPKDVFSWLFSLTDERPYKFLVLTTVARIPSVLTSTWCGKELIEGNYRLSIAIFLLTAAASLLFALAYAAKRKMREKEEGL